MSTTADAVSTGSNIPVRPAFAYEPLNYSLDPNAIRLLRVLPTLLDGNIQVEIQQGQPGVVRPEAARCSSLALDGKQIPGYRCLSYNWGEPCEGRDILLNGCTFRVRDTCSNSWTQPDDFSPWSFCGLMLYVLIKIIWLKEGIK
jgi:hypothetical protein